MTPRDDTYAERVAAVERWERYVKRAVSYLGKARFAIDIKIKNKSLLYFMRYDYEKLLDETLETAYEILEALPDDFFADDAVEDIFGLGASLGVNIGGMKYNSSDDVCEAAQKIVTLLERRRGDAKKARRIALLENTDGRTTEEAAAYRAKAAELRAK
jgi:hypothetical protein